MHNDTELQHDFLLLHLAIQPLKSYRKYIVDLQLVPDYIRMRFVHSVNLPNNLEQKSVLSVTRPFLSAKGQQCLTRNAL